MENQQTNILRITSNIGFILYKCKYNKKMASDVNEISKITVYIIKQIIINNTKSYESKVVDEIFDELTKKIITFRNNYKCEFNKDNDIECYVNGLLELITKEKEFLTK
jgi:hypothetical protein